MIPAKFLTKLIFTAAASMALVFVVSLFLPIWNYLQFLGVSIVAFSIFCLLLYVFAYRSIGSTNQNSFTFVFLGFTLFKMILAVMLVVVFFYWLNPADNYFVFPFLLVYLVYTIFEVHFMTIIGKMTTLRSS